MVGVSDAADREREAQHGTALLPSDLTDEQLAAAPVLASINALLTEELSEDEDEAFVAAARFVRVVIDTGVFSASRSRRRRQTVRGADRPHGRTPDLPGRSHRERAPNMALSWPGGVRRAATVSMRRSR